MDVSEFEPQFDESKFSVSYEAGLSSPDHTRLAGVFTDSDGDWLYVGSFESGMRRIQVDLAPSFEYTPLRWISNSEVVYAHYDGLFGIVDVDTGEREVFGERTGHFKPLGEIDGVVVGMVDSGSDDPRFRIVGGVRETGEVKTLVELNSACRYFDWPMFVDGDSIYVEEYLEGAESLADHGVHRFRVSYEDGEVCVDSGFRPIWEDASATALGAVNRFLIVQKGGLDSEQLFSDDDSEDGTLFLYDWDRDELLDFEFEGEFGSVLTEELIVSTVAAEDGISNVEREAVFSRVTAEGNVEVVRRHPVSLGYDWWCLVNDTLYGHSYDDGGCVAYRADGVEPVLTLDSISLGVDSKSIDTIELDIAEGYSAKVYSLLDVERDDLEERPIVVCAYPAADITIRDAYGMELLERGFLIVNPIYDDGEYYGKTLALKELLQELSERDYCGNVGLYGFSGGGTQVLNYAGSAYSELVDCVFAGCPNFELGTETGHDAYMRPIEFEDEAPLLFKDYSPLYHLDAIDVPTRIITAKYDTRVNHTPLDEVRNRVDDEIVSVAEFDRGHMAVRFEDSMAYLSEIVEFCEEQLLD